LAQLLTITSEGVTLRQEIADAGARLAAGIVDLVVLSLLLLLLALTAVAVGTADPTGVSGFFVGLLAGGVILLVLGYHVLFHQLAGGRTPGKMLLSIRVVSADGYPPSFLAIVLRALVWPIDVLPLLILPIGLVVIALSPRRQRLGDIVAGTVVVHARERAIAPEPWPGQLWSTLPERALPLSPLSLARLDARDVELLRQLITRPSLHPDERRRLFVDAARHYAERLDLGPFQDARLVLRELYLFAREHRAAAS
jgi:uncharacterized RDD family membrane protein YckC